MKVGWFLALGLLFALAGCTQTSAPKGADSMNELMKEDPNKEGAPPPRKQLFDENSPGPKPGRAGG